MEDLTLGSEQDTKVQIESMPLKSFPIQAWQAHKQFQHEATQDMCHTTYILSTLQMFDVFRRLLHLKDYHIRKRFRTLTEKLLTSTQS